MKIDYNINWARWVQFSERELNLTLGCLKRRTPHDVTNEMIAEIEMQLGRIDNDKTVKYIMEYVHTQLDVAAEVGFIEHLDNGTEVGVWFPSLQESRTYTLKGANVILCV